MDERLDREGHATCLVAVARTQGAQRPHVRTLSLVDQRLLGENHLITLVVVAGREAQTALAPGASTSGLPGYWIVGWRTRAWV